MSPTGLGSEQLAAVAGASDQNTRSIRPGKGKDKANFETIGSRKENGVRKSRNKSPINVVAIRRTIVAAMSAGLPIGQLEISTDGTIRLSIAETPSSAPTAPEDLFREWEARL